MMAESSVSAFALTISYVSLEIMPDGFPFLGLTKMMIRWKKIRLRNKAHHSYIDLR